MSTPNAMPRSPNRAVGHVGAILSTLGFLAGVNQVTNGQLPMLFLLIVTIMFYIVAYVAVTLFQTIALPKESRKGVQFYAKVLLNIMMLSFFLLVFVFLGTLIFGIPVDNRNLISSTYVKRMSWPIENGKRQIKLTTLNGTELLKRKVFDPSTLPSSDRKSRQAIWQEWLYNGAKSPGTVLLVYESDQFKNYYEKTSGSIVFADAGSSSAVKLADCFGFIANVDDKSGMQTLRQLDLAPGLKNMDAKPGEGTQNELNNLIVDSGDRIIIVVQLVGVDASATPVATIDLK